MSIAMSVEDIYTFFREEMDPEFAAVWAQVAEHLDSPDSYDVKVDCIDGQSCYSYQSLLSVSSDCFRNAFDYYYDNSVRQLADDEGLVIGLPSLVDYENLNAIIKYIHSGSISIPESRVLSFLEVSKFLAIKGLQDIRLVYLNEIDNFNQILISNQSTRVREQPKQPNYVLELRDMIESDDSDDMSDSDIQLNDNYNDLDLDLNFGFKTESFTAIKEYPNEKCSTNVTQMAKKSSIASSVRRIGQQGRRPQIGSPLITEEFRCGDRYQCKVCLKSYSWKKSLVRHYKDLHLTNVQLVTE